MFGEKTAQTSVSGFQLFKLCTKYGNRSIYLNLHVQNYFSHSCNSYSVGYYNFIICCSLCYRWCMANHCIWSPSNCQKHVCTNWWKHCTSPYFFERSLCNTLPNLKWRQMKNCKANWSITCVLPAEISHLFSICLLGFLLICPMWAVYNARVSGCPENLLLLCLTHSDVSLVYQFCLWDHRCIGKFT